MGCGHLSLCCGLWELLSSHHMKSTHHSMTTSHKPFWAVEDMLPDKAVWGQPLPEHLQKMRVPEPSPTRQSSPVRPPASPASSVSLPDGQRPPLPSTTLMRKPGEDDSCSILASGSEDWVSSVDLAPSARASSGKRASIESELMRVLAQAATSLGLEWSTPEQPAHNRLDGYFLPGQRASPASRPAPFLPELHEEVAKSWNAPFSARMRSSVSLAFSAVDDAKNRGYHSLSPVEAIAAHLCPPSAGRRAKLALPSKACRMTSTLLGRAFSTAGQAASALHTMATLQIFQADLLRKLTRKDQMQFACQT
ncbi:unnamed protein product [Leuciscus chuanchicus]